MSKALGAKTILSLTLAFGFEGSKVLAPARSNVDGPCIMVWLTWPRAGDRASSLRGGSTSGSAWWCAVCGCRVLMLSGLDMPPWFPTGL